MAKKTYRISLEVTVETDTPDVDIDFRRYVEDGQLYIWPEHEEDAIVACYEAEKTLIREEK